MKNNKKISSLKSNLAAYSATAAAAVLAAPSADAAIQNITSGTITFNLSSHFEFSSKYSLGPFNIRFTGKVAANSGIAVIGPAGFRCNFNIFSTPDLALNLAHGVAIAGPTGQGYVALALKSNNNHLATGYFLPAANAAKTGYAGLKAVEGGKTYYGWLRLKVTANGGGFPTSISVLSEDGVVGAFGLPSDHITAGELAAPTPEPSTLAIGGLSLLALGARGVRELRRRREQAAMN